MMVHFQNASAKKNIFFQKCCNIVRFILNRRKIIYLLQMPQWCVLAGLGMIHFLQMDTNGESFFSWINKTFSTASGNVNSKHNNHM